ncbi:MAG: type II toxin-antitoxin system RelE/ParE family toxin [Bacteroidales bacterium]|nr:type II toxin-antitoxin system RelE/ParE family toxin [Bacteroidales bacterium]
MKVEWLDAANNDLLEVAELVFLQFGLSAARRAVAEVTADTARIGEFPEIGRRCNEYTSTKRQYRALHTRHNRIVYTIQPDCVLIVAIFDTRRDPAKLEALLRSREWS